MAKEQSVYPTSIDDLTTDRQSGQLITSASYDIIEDAIYALEAMVGVSSTSAASTAYGLAREHADRHENGGVDEVSVAGLSGELADLQPVKDHTHQSAGSGVGGKLDHGAALDGLGDDDHTQYVLHSLADAANDFLVASGANTFVKKTLAETGAILEADIDHGNIQGIETDDHDQYAMVLGRAAEDLVCQQDVKVNRTIYVNEDHGVGTEDAIIYFNNPASGHTLKFFGTKQRFEFTRALYSSASLFASTTVTAGTDVKANGSIYVNADYSAGDEDAIIYFNSTNESLQWDFGNSRFNLSDDLFVSGFVYGTSWLYGDYLVVQERADTGSATANQCNIYARDTGGKTELVAVFQSGAVQRLAIEP